MLMMAIATLKAQVILIYKNGTIVKEYNAGDVQQVQFTNGQSDELVVAKSASQTMEYPITSSPKLLIGDDMLTFTDNTNSTKFSIDEKVSLYMQGKNVAPFGKCLAVTCAEAKPNAWDSQIFINFPTLLEKGKSYTLTMNVRGSKVLEPKQGQWGPEAIQLILQDNNSSNRDEWGGPADLQYLAHFAVTTEWVYNITDLDGNTIVTDGNYPYSRVLLNLGNYAGTLYIDNVRAIDENGTEVFCITFETPEEQALVENGWMNLPKEFVDAANSISSVSTDTTSSFTFNLYGQKANATDGFRIQNGKVILVK